MAEYVTQPTTGDVIVSNGRIFQLLYVLYHQLEPHPALFELLYIYVVLEVRVKRYVLNYFVLIANPNLWRCGSLTLIASAQQQILSKFLCRLMVNDPFLIAILSRLDHSRC